MGWRPRFWKSKELTDISFLDAVKRITKQEFSNAVEAKTWLNANGYWTNYVNELDYIIITPSNYVNNYTDNVVWGWGYNNVGQLGDNSTANRCTPVSILGTKKTFCQITAGDNHTIGIDKNGQVWAWGYNLYGQLGDNSVTNKSTPVSILGTKKTFCQITAGASHTIGIDKNGQVWGWGYNNRGQLGDNSVTNRCTPVCGRLERGVVF